MELRIDGQGETAVAVLAEDSPVIQTVQDALDFMATARHMHDCHRLLIPKAAICEDFFDLRTGLAGEILQKFTNYGARVAFTGDFSGYTSRALRDFIRESNRTGRVVFLPTEREALQALRT